MAARVDYVWLFFRLRGRISRLVFLLASLFLSCVVGLFYYRYVVTDPGSENADAWASVLALAFAVGLWSSVALGVKRIHDLNKPGVAAVSLVLPVISVVVFVVLCLLPGSPGPNQYGERADEPA